jgi:outer membrane protein assembly factor BamE (lipoprotein component of BamABCDE complex)
MQRWIPFAVLSLSLLAACDGSDSGSSSPNQMCLTDAQICQVHIGVSTENDVQAALGAPSVTQSISNGGSTLQQWVYICQKSSQSADLVQVVLDGTVVESVSVSRAGGALPPKCGT